MLKLRIFCLTARLFLHILHVPLHKLRHGKKAQHAKKNPQHRIKPATPNWVSFNLSLFCCSAEQLRKESGLQGLAPAVTKDSYHNGFGSKRMMCPGLDAHTHKANLDSPKMFRFV